MSPEIVFTLAAGQNAFFRELAEALAFELEKLGATSRIQVDDFPEQRAGSVTVLLPPHEYASISGVRPSAAMLRRCVLISAEQPTSVFFSWNLELAQYAGGVMDINHRAVRAYRERGIAADHLQLGYSEAWDRRRAASDRDIDVLFVGRSSERREHALALYAGALERHACQILLSDNSQPNTEANVNFQAREGKLDLLSRSKVVLNVHGEKEPYFEWLRAVEAISCGCAVVTEHSTDMEPLRAGVDVLAGRLETLGLLASWLAEDGGKRDEFVANADTRMGERAMLEKAAQTLLEKALEADRLEVPPNASADVAVANAKMALIPAGITESDPSDECSVGERRALRALKRQQVENQSLWRRLEADTLARSRPERPDAETIDLGATSAWLAGPTGAEVSVVVPLYNHGDVVLEALDSVLRSTFSLWEIVVVDDASSDGGPDKVLGWMAENDSSPVALVGHEVNRGLSAARNTGAEKARGEMLMMLDSDNLLRSHGLRRLVEALRDDRGAAFSYGILDRFLQEKQVDLVNKYGWEPSRLREGNYIDALALIRRGAFLDLGGYSADARLFGYEDYDFWARLAEAGQRGAFVRHFVGRYRMGHSSMLSVTNISTTDAVAAIVEHAPTLMSGVELRG